MAGRRLRATPSNAGDLHPLQKVMMEPLDSVVESCQAKRESLVQYCREAPGLRSGSSWPQLGVGASRYRPRPFSSRSGAEASEFGSKPCAFESAPRTSPHLGVEASDLTDQGVGFEALKLKIAKSRSGTSWSRSRAPRSRSRASGSKSRSRTSESRSYNSSWLGSRPRCSHPSHCGRARGHAPPRLGPLSAPAGALREGQGEETWARRGTWNL